MMTSNRPEQALADGVGENMARDPPSEMFVDPEERSERDPERD